MKTVFIIAFFSLFANCVEAEKLGCTDPLSLNYDASATRNDGSCVYNQALVIPTSSVNLPEIMVETSGLIYWNDNLWTHNDSEDINLYAFKVDAPDDYLTYEVTATMNVDWEEISQDDHYIYIGDFGNNGNGNRADLKILRIDKNSVLSNAPIVETIHFSYSTQTEFNPAGPNNTNFDCEAFVVTADSIYLFTKEWVSNKTSIFSLPKSPGTYIARFKSDYDVQGLITGAIYMEEYKLIALSGYNAILQPFIYLLYDFTGRNFFNGNKRKIDIDLSLHQVEGITSQDGLIYYLTNEKFVFSSLVVPQKLSIVDLTEYIEGYLTRTPGYKPKEKK